MVVLLVHMVPYGHGRRKCHTPSTMFKPADHVMLLAFRTSLAWTLEEANIRVCMR